MIYMDRKTHILKAEKPGQVHIVMGGPDLIETMRKSLLNDGWTVLDQGTKQWVDHRLVFDTDKSGSDAYTWDKNGDRCAYDKVLVTLSGDGRLEKVLRRVYRGLE